MSFGGHPPGRYSDFERMPTPAQNVPLLPPPTARKVAGDDSKQGLYRLLGQDLDIAVEAHADAYEQARKKWSECSVEEWTKGADGAFSGVSQRALLIFAAAELGERFTKMLDFVSDFLIVRVDMTEDWPCAQVKDHMT